MTTIVLNTVNRAVTEYAWAFQSVSSDHAADANGLYTLGGDNDNGAPITGEIRGGKSGGETLQKVGNVYLALSGAGGGTLIVMGRTNEWEYPIQARPSGVCLAHPGQGIRESYIGFGYRNAAGTDFRLDRIDADVQASKNRRN